jgi:hypothetical protein
MIPDLIFGLLLDFVTWFMHALPAVTIPSWLGSTGTVVTSAGTWGADAAGFGGWIPFTAIGNVITSVLVAIPLAVSVRLVRIVLSYMTGGGGAA